MPAADYTTIALAVLVILLAIVLFRLVSTRKSAEPQARLRKAAKAMLSDVLIPDGEDGEILIENALLCARGIVVVDIKDIEGNIFGSDAMHDWTVITGKKRFTFANPQPGLYDRTAAVAALVPDVPVSGYIAFTSRGKFTKGRPGNVTDIDTLIRELTAESKTSGAAINAFLPGWDTLRDAAVVAQLGHLIDD
jgi:hypothetical protein